MRQRCTRKAASLGTKSHLTNQLRGCGRTRPTPDPCVNSPPLNRVRKQGLFEVRVLLSQLLPVSTRAGGASVSTHKVRTIGGTSLPRTFLPQAKVAPPPLSSLLVASGQEHSEVRSDNRNPRRLLFLSRAHPVLWLRPSSPSFSLTHPPHALIFCLPLPIFLHCVCSPSLSPTTTAHVLFNCTPTLLHSSTNRTTLPTYHAYPSSHLVSTSSPIPPAHAFPLTSSSSLSLVHPAQAAVHSSILVSTFHDSRRRLPYRWLSLRHRPRLLHNSLAAPTPRLWTQLIDCHLSTGKVLGIRLIHHL